MLRPLNPERCPVEQALEIVGGKWKPLILWRLSRGTLRFNQLQRAVAGITQRMLTLQLRELERDGMVHRAVYAEVPPRVEYTLSAPAHRLLPALSAIGSWLLENHGALQAQRDPEHGAVSGGKQAFGAQRFLH